MSSKGKGQKFELFPNCDLPRVAAVFEKPTNKNQNSKHYTTEKVKGGGVKGVMGENQSWSASMRFKDERVGGGRSSQACENL